MGTVTYQVLREHLGDRNYAKGETRELNESDAKHLVESGVLAPAGEAASETAKAKQDAVQAASPDLVEQAKAERAAPQNKAEPVPDFNKTKPRVPRE